MFKSYYVVWKRKNEACEGDGSRWFKSYYVVWKHRYDLCEYLDE